MAEGRKVTHIHTHVPLSGLVIAAEMEVDACVVIAVLKKYVLLM